MLKKFLLPALLGLLGVGLLIMAVTGMLDTSPGVDFVQGEMDGTRIDISAKFSALPQRRGHSVPVFEVEPSLV